MTVHFDIGRITLHGYSPRQQEQFAASLRERLEGLTTNQAGASRRIDHVDAGVLPAGATPEQAAARVAAAILRQAGVRDA